MLEDDPLFNAGKGAVFTAEGRNELDASIMDGRTRQAGAVAGVTRTRQSGEPRARGDGKIQARHAGRARARTLSRCEQGLEQVDPGYFRTEERWQQFLQWRDKTRLRCSIARMPTGPSARSRSTRPGTWRRPHRPVALIGKRWGRVGDSPIIGAGTYAEDGDLRGVGDG